MAYTIEQYLLDKTHIHDLVVNMYWFADTRQLPSAVLGFPPKEVTAQEQVDQWSHMLPLLGESSHFVIPTAAELPVPDGKIAPPTTCKVGAHARVYMRRERNGETIQTDGIGRNHFEVVKTDASGNPWRVKFVKAEHIHHYGVDGFWKP